MLCCLHSLRPNTPSTPIGLYLLPTNWPSSCIAGPDLLWLVAIVQSQPFEAGHTCVETRIHARVSAASRQATSPPYPHQSSLITVFHNPPCLTCVDARIQARVSAASSSLSTALAASQPPPLLLPKWNVDYHFLVSPLMMHASRHVSLHAGPSQPLPLISVVFAGRQAIQHPTSPLSPHLPCLTCVEARIQAGIITTPTPTSCSTKSFVAVLQYLSLLSPHLC
jgi:hypothetical protein